MRNYAQVLWRVEEMDVGPRPTWPRSLAFVTPSDCAGCDPDSVRVQSGVALGFGERAGCTVATSPAMGQGSLAGYQGIERKDEAR
jgi:hypothetical protein